MTKKILIIEDDIAITDSLKMMLEMEGYAVAIITDATKAYHLAKYQADLILLDIWMSGQDGRDIAKKVKSNKETKHIPIIMISASKDIEKSALDAGVDDYLAKPFEMDELLAKIAQQLHKTK